MSMSPFEIRLELLKMAKDMLESDYFGKREMIANQFATDCDAAKTKGAEPPKHPGYPDYPSEEVIIKKATTLNAFVSMMPPDATKPKKS